MMLAVAKVDAKNVMQMNWLYRMLSSEEIIQRIRGCKEEEEIYEILIEARKNYKEREKKDMNLLEILDLDLIDLEMKASNKDEVLYQLSSMLYKRKISKIWTNFWKLFTRERVSEKQDLEGLQYLMG